MCNHRDAVKPEVVRVRDPSDGLAHLMLIVSEPTKSWISPEQDPCLFLCSVLWEVRPLYPV